MTRLAITPEELAPRPRTSAAPRAPLVPRERVGRKDRPDGRQEDITSYGGRARGYLGFRLGPVRAESEGPIPNEGPLARELRDRICARYGVSQVEIVSARRSREVVRARHHLMWLLRKETHWSLPHIGRFLGGRDHTTVMHGIRAHEARIRQGEAR
jgi:hypothetical protein